MIIEDMRFVEKGTTVEIWYLKRKILDIDMEGMGIAHRNMLVLKGEAKAKILEVELENDEEKAKITMVRVDQFIQAYLSLMYKYTRQRRTYKVGTKSHNAFIQAAATADKFDIDFDKYIRLITKHYSEKNRSEKNTLPWPMQFAGDIAEQIIIDQLAKNTEYVDPVLMGKRRAISNQYVPLKKDNDYIDIRERIKLRTATKEDISYMETRQIQIYGTPKDWIAKVKKELFGDDNV